MRGFPLVMTRPARYPRVESGQVRWPQRNELGRVGSHRYESMADCACYGCPPARPVARVIYNRYCFSGAMMKYCNNSYKYIPSINRATYWSSVGSVTELRIFHVDGDGIRA